MPRPLSGRVGRSHTGDAAPPDRSVARPIVALVVAGAAGAALLAAYATYRIWDQGNRDERRPAGAIVVLGAAQYDGTPSPVFRARLDHAIALWLDDWAPYLVVTGGKQGGDRMTEAGVARAYAIERGVPPERILMEEEGRTTLESIRAVADLLHAAGIRDAIFVSDRTHMLRVLRIARDEGIVAWGSPTPFSPIESSSSLRWQATVHELAALAYYFLTGAASILRLAAP